jgi:hypothetical protein
MSNPMTKEKSNNNALKSILGAEAYLEYKTDLSGKADLKKQDAIVQTQTKLVIEKVEDKFERRLVEETTKLDKRITKEIGNLDRRMMEKFDSQLKWIIGTMIGLFFAMSTLITGMIYFLHQ